MASRREAPRPLPEGSREANVAPVADIRTQFTSSRYLEPFGQLGTARPRLTYHRPNGNSPSGQLHCSVKEEEFWTAQYGGLEEARKPVAHLIAEYNQDRSHRGAENRTTREPLLDFAGELNSEALSATF